MVAAADEHMRTDQVLAGTHFSLRRSHLQRRQWKAGMYVGNHEMYRIPLRVAIRG